MLALRATRRTGPADLRAREAFYLYFENHSEIYGHAVILKNQCSDLNLPARDEGMHQFPQMLF